MCSPCEQGEKDNRTVLETRICAVRVQRSSQRAVLASKHIALAAQLADLAQLLARQPLLRRRPLTLTLGPPPRLLRCALRRVE